MAKSQDTFGEPAIGVAGQLGDSRDRTVESWEAGGAVGFGLAVVRSAEDTAHLELASSGADNVATNFVGITLRGPVRPSTDDPTTYAAGDTMRVLTRGTVKVVADGAVTQGQDVTFKANGRLGTAAPTNTTVKRIAGATWATSAATGEVAVVKLSGFRTPA